MNNDERSQWIDNDEGLYNMWKSSRQSKRDFIRDNKEFIDEAIQNVTSGRKRQHYLTYGERSAREGGVTYRFYSYDVWGNEEDGFEVNDTFKTSHTVNLPLEASDEQIKKALKAEGIVAKKIKDDDIDLEDLGEGWLGITDARNGRPFGEIRVEEKNWKYER